MKDAFIKYVQLQVRDSGKPRLFLWFMRIVPALIVVVGGLGILADVQFILNGGEIGLRANVLLVLSIVVTVYSMYLLYMMVKKKQYPFMVTQTMLYLGCLSLINVLQTLVFNVSDAPLIFIFVLVLHFAVVVYSGILAYVYKLSLSKDYVTTVL